MVHINTEMFDTVEVGENILTIKKRMELGKYIKRTKWKNIYIE